MKQKFFLMISVVLLFAVQGWAEPTDSLTRNEMNSMSIFNSFDICDVSGSTKGIKTDDFNTYAKKRKKVSSNCEAYDLTEWVGYNNEFMDFSLGCVKRLNIKVLSDIDTVLYLRAFQGYLESPLTIEMTNSHEAFDFQTQTIYPNELTALDYTMYPKWPNAKWCGKTMRIGFHASAPGTYTATFKITGTSNAVKEFTLRCNVVEDLSGPSIHVSPSTILPFACEVGATDTQQFKVIAKNQTGPLRVEIMDDLDVIMDYPIGVPFPNDKQTQGRFSFTIVGSNVTEPTTSSNEATTISAEDAAQGAILTIKYDPKYVGGYHQAKAVIYGNGEPAQIHLRGHSSAGKIFVSDNRLTFPNGVIGEPFEKTFTITGTDLTDDSVYVNLNDEMFSIVGYDKFSANEVKQGVTVTVKYKPKNIGTHTAQITIFGGGTIEGNIVNLLGSTEEPSVTVNPSSWDFGNVPEGATVAKIFTVTGINLTDDMHLTLAQTGAHGYMSLNRDKLPANGGTVIVTCEAGEAGSFSGRLKISGGGILTPITVDLSGKVIGTPTIIINPSSYSFGNVVKDTPAHKTFTIIGANLTEDLTLATDSSFFTVNPNRITPEAAANGATVTVTYLPTEAGTHSATLTVNGNSVSKTACLSGKCIIPTITVDKSSLDFGNISLGTTATMSLKVTGTDLTGPMTLTLAETGAHGYLSINRTSLSADGGTVIVTCQAADAGSFNGLITISGGSATSKKVSISGKVIPLPAIVTSEPETFSNVVVGDYKTTTFTIKGSGYSSNLSLALSGSSMFSINTTTITPAQAAAGATVKVTYKPTAAGTHTAKVTISGGSAVESTIVNLKGTAIVREIKATPAAVTFSKVTVGKTATQTFTVTATNPDAPLTLKLNDNTGMYSISKTSITAAQAASGATVTVTYKPTAAGSHAASITITGGGALNEKIVSISGSAVKRVITTSDLNVTFYNTIVNQTKTKTFTVNASNLTGPLTVKLNDGSGMFSIDKSSITAAQAASGATITVKYKPTSKGAHTATIDIYGGDALEGKTVTLKGTAVVPTITTSKSALNFYETGGTKSFTVTGTNLTGSLSLSVSDPTHFTLSKTTISASEAASGATVSVTCIPKAATRLNATITISGGGASSKTVTLSYSSTPVQINAVEPDGEGKDGSNGDGSELFMNGGELEIFENSTTIVNEMSMDVKIYAEGQNIIIESPISQDAMICDITGRAHQVCLEAGRNEISVNTNGVHIVRVGEKTTKLMLQ